MYDGFKSNPNKNQVYKTSPLTVPHVELVQTEAIRTSAPPSPITKEVEMAKPSILKPSTHKANDRSAFKNRVQFEVNTNFVREVDT
jgi:hypothetical protein